MPLHLNPFGADSMTEGAVDRCAADDGDLAGTDGDTRSRSSVGASHGMDMERL